MAAAAVSSLCDAFPTLFDLVDESTTMEVDGVAKDDYAKVVDQCYLCDLCYQTKCPYVPPHEWSVDFPHLMLRAKAVQFNKGERKLSHKLLSNTKTARRSRQHPGGRRIINAANENATLRKVLEKTLDLDHRAHLPQFHADTLRNAGKRTTRRQPSKSSRPGRPWAKSPCLPPATATVNTPDMART